MDKRYARNTKLTFIFILTAINNIKEWWKTPYLILDDTNRMSAAIARKRRAETSAINPSPSPSPSTSTRMGSGPASVNPGQGQGLTLPQVISVIDTRLIVLETFMKDTKEGKMNNTPQPPPLVQESIPETNEIMEEMDTRFDILAREIADLKDIVLKLQAYTMDVNKTLLEERIHILSDLDPSVPGDSNSNPNPNFTLTDTLLSSNSI